MKKTITLTVEQARELYENDNSFRGTILSEFSDVELGIKKELKSWEELGEISGFYITTRSDIKNIPNIGVRQDTENVFKTKKQAESTKAMAKLSQLMADLNDECDLDWEDEGSKKYVILRIGNRASSDYTRLIYQFLAFKTIEVRDAFLQKNIDLIKQYLMI